MSSTVCNVWGIQHKIKRIESMLKHYRLHLISTIVGTGKFRIADLHWKVLTQWAIYLNDSIIEWERWVCEKSFRVDGLSKTCSTMRANAIKSGKYSKKGR